MKTLLKRLLPLMLLVGFATVSMAHPPSAPQATPAGGSGDVTSVSDCTDGACLDGSSDGGTYARFYDDAAFYMQLAVEAESGKLRLPPVALA